MDEPLQVTQGVIALIEQAGRWLVICRAAGVPAPGCWCFPGGAVEPGELQADALVREMDEELGLKVRPSRAIWEWVRPDGRLRLTWWMATLVDPRAALRCNPAEVAEARWVTPEEFVRLEPGLPSNHAFVDWWRAATATDQSTT